MQGYFHVYSCPEHENLSVFGSVFIPGEGESGFPNYLGVESGMNPCLSLPIRGQQSPFCKSNYLVSGRAPTFRCPPPPEKYKSIQLLKCDFWHYGNLEKKILLLLNSKITSKQIFNEKMTAKYYWCCNINSHCTWLLQPEH